MYKFQDFVLATANICSNITQRVVLVVIAKIYILPWHHKISAVAALLIFPITSTLQTKYEYTK